MHHEDRAGVNALIRGIDEFARDRLPGVVILCTNRLDAIDPAVQRRSAAPFVFDRPDSEQRARVLSALLEGVAITEEQMSQLVSATGPDESRPGYTYSDLTQRLAPTAVLSVFPSRALSAEAFLAAVATTSPTPPFGAAAPAPAVAERSTEGRGPSR